MSKFDGVIEAVRYAPNGQVEWVRAYERRGAVFSDSVLIDRARLIEKLGRGKRFMLGKRITYQAGTFDVSVPVRLIGHDDAARLSSDLIRRDHDHLEGVPVI